MFFTDRKITPEMIEWVRKVDALPMHVRILQKNKYTTPIPQSWLDLEKLIGDYSEGIFHCSYNDEDVLSLLVRGEMNSFIARTLERRGYLGNMEILPDGDYAKPLMDLVEKAGGWLEGISNLTKLEPYLKELNFVF